MVATAASYLSQTMILTDSAAEQTAVLKVCQVFIAACNQHSCSFVPADADSAEFLPELELRIPSTHGEA